MIHNGHNNMESGHFHAMQLLTNGKRPTAIFCTNNMMAMGALAAIQEIGLACPEEISLLGFDDFIGPRFCGRGSPWSVNPQEKWG